MKKLPAKYTPWVMPLILSFIMSSLISLINIIKALGLVDGLFVIWMQAWALSWVIAYPTVLLVLPIVKWIMSKIVEAPTQINPHKTNGTKSATIAQFFLLSY